MGDYLRTKPMAVAGAIMAVVAYVWNMFVASMLTSLPAPVGSIVTWAVWFAVFALVYNRVQMI